MPNNNPVTWFEIGTATGQKAAAKEFYERTFGWKFTDVPGMDYTMLDRGDGSGPGIGGGLYEDADGPVVRISIEVSGLKDYLEKAVANGATIVQDIVTVPDMVTYAQVKDPSGNVIGLIEATPPRQE